MEGLRLHPAQGLEGVDGRTVPRGVGLLLCHAGECLELVCGPAGDLRGLGEGGAVRKQRAHATVSEMMQAVRCSSVHTTAS